MDRKYLKICVFTLCLLLCGERGLKAQTNESETTQVTNATSTASDVNTNQPALATNAIPIPAIATPMDTNAPVFAANSMTVSDGSCCTTNVGSCCSSNTRGHHPVEVSAEFGTTGAGGTASVRFADHLGLRAGMDYFSYTHYGKIEDVDYNARGRLLSESAALDLYPWASHSFHVSLGALFNQTRFTGSPNPGQDITLDGTTYTAAEYGSLHLRIKQPAVNPYVSIGANFFCFDHARHWSLGGELGVAYGKWDVSLDHTGGSNPAGLDQAVADQKAKLDNQLRKYPVWPIVKLQLSYAF